MKCPYSNSLMPPCQIESHPQKQNVEYCKVCGQWRHISDVGDEFPNIFWTLLAIAIVITIFMGMVRDAEHDPMPRQELNSATSDRG